MEFGHGVGYTSPPGASSVVEALPETEDAPA